MNKVSVFTMFVLLVSCAGNNSHKISESEKEEIKAKCLESKEFTLQPTYVVGYDLEIVDTILILEWNKEELIDSFNLYVNKNSHLSDYEKESKEYPLWNPGHPPRIMNVDYRYDFLIGSDTIKLDDLTMTTREVDHDIILCEMSRYTLNGEWFEEYNIQFTNPKFETTDIFDEFYDKFIADSIFQMSRIKFPIKGNYTDYSGSESWTEENWPLLDWDYREEIKKTTDSVSVIETDSSFYFGTFCQDCGFSFWMQFEKFDGKWFLSGRQENNF